MNPSPAQHHPFPMWLLLFAAAASLICIRLGWGGFIASDDEYYLWAAEQLLEPGFFIPENHWSFRYTQIWPLAAALAVFGSSETVLALPTIAYSVALVVLAAWYANQQNGTLAGVLSVLFLSSLPVIASRAGIANVDVSEAFIALLALILTVQATRTQRARDYILLGACLAIAVFNRETGVAMVVFCGLGVLLFARNRVYAIGQLAIAPLAMFVVETAYYWWQTGDWIYRARVVMLKHLGIGRTGDVDQSSAGIVVGDSDTGNLVEGGLFEPVATLVINQEYGALFLLLPLLVIIFLLIKSSLSGCYRPLMFLLVGALVWFLLIGYVLPIRSIARYYLPTGVFVALFGAIVLSKAWHHTSKLLVLLVALGIPAGNLAGIYVENKDYLFGERCVLDRLERSGGLIHVDPEGYANIEQLLKWSDEADLTMVTKEPPADGALFAYNQRNVDQGHANFRGFDKSLYTPAETWEEVDRCVAPTKLIAPIVDWVGLDRVLPEHFVRKFKKSNYDLIFYIKQ